VLRLTVSFGLLLGLGVAGAGYVAPPAAVAQDADPVAEWDKRWDKALKDAANEYVKISAKYNEKLASSAAYIRRFVLRYLPDDKETRKFLGYAWAKQGDGTEKWEPVDTIRDEIRERTDLDDPKTTKFEKDKMEATKRIIAAFKGLAKKAIENGTAKDVSADKAKEWKEKEQRAWERVLEVDEGKAEYAKDMDEAHKALGHPKYEGKLVSPFKQQFMKARAERKRIGEKENNAVIKPINPVECDGEFVSAGLAGGGAKSDHFVVNTSHGKDMAIRLCSAAEKALLDTIAVVGFPEEIKERVSTKFNIVKDDDEFRKIMEKGFGWKPAQVTKHIEHHLTGVGDKGQRIAPRGNDPGADDGVANQTVALYCVRAARDMARADLGSATKEDVEDWLWQSLGYDVTTRILGSRRTHYGTFGRYGEAVEPRPGEDVWIELARRLVVMDDDEPIVKLVKRQLDKQDFKPPQLIKGWALLQFLYEKDTDKAKKFVWHALADGTPAAMAAIYPDDIDSPDPEKSMEKIDAEYRLWIQKAW
jgi:hypothetical protein